jgi:predicted short-subunit dehydrogenase-like oxidoreductase (DUF2520 family)
MIQRAHVIGMGRLGRPWAQRLEALGIVTQRWSRKAGEDVRPMSTWENAPDADAIFLAVPDDALASVVDQITPNLGPETILIHHAGAVPAEVLKVPPAQRAVLWPPMTFVSGHTPDWDTLPLGVETANDALRQWSRTLAPRAFDLTSHTRPALHLGAVLAGNLTAAWLGTVENHLLQHGLALDVLAPLIQESVANALKGQALHTVSGPAARNDRSTLNRQQSALAQGSEAAPDLPLLHHILTNCILQHHGYDRLPPFQAAAEAH